MAKLAVANISPTTKAEALVEHLGYLDGLRAVTALFVVLHHIVYQVIIKSPVSPRLVPFLAPLFHGHDAVDLFIVVSGFCLMLPVIRHEEHMRQTAGRFFVQRARRILPPYYLAALFSYGMIVLFIHEKTGTIWDASLPVTVKSLLTHLLLVQDAVGEEHTLNYVFWSVAVEWRIYFLFPILVLGFRLAGPLVTTALTIFASYIAYSLCHRFFGVTLSLHYVGLFAMGMLGTSIAHAGDVGILATVKHWVPWDWLTVLLFGLVLSFDHVSLYHGHAPTEDQADYLVGLGSMSLLVLITTRKDCWTRLILNFRPLVFTGTFAYSIYLIHAPLLQMLWLVLPAQIQTQPVVALSLLSTFGIAVVIGVSYGFFLLCERPFLTKRKSSALVSMVAKTVLKPAP